MTVKAINGCRLSAEIVLSLRELGYLSDTMKILDPTTGENRGFWSLWQPKGLIESDNVHGVDLMADYRELPFKKSTFDAVVFDPPFKLNGTPSDKDKLYGVHVIATRDERLASICLGFRECARILKSKGYLIAKVQDQVNGGKVRWQTLMLYEESKEVDLALVDSLLLESYREQPAGRSQHHARRNYSTFMVFQKK
jgi:hypothetical protein